MSRTSRLILEIGSEIVYSHNQTLQLEHGTSATVYISLNKHPRENARAQSRWKHDISGCELAGSENDVSGCFLWLISDWARPLVHLLIQQRVLSLFVRSVLKGTFLHGLKAGKGVYILSVLSFLHSLLLASRRNKPLQWLVILVLLTTSENVGGWVA